MIYKGIIFDLDGVICFTDEYHYQAWKAVADKLGLAFSREINNRLRGVSRMESLEIILETSKVRYSVAEKEQIAAEKNTLYRELLNRMTPCDLPEEVRNTLNRLKAGGYKMAIGSSSKNTQMILKKVGLDNFFDAVSDGNNITHSKPDPEVFIKAAQMLDLKPEECLVVEDAVSGAQAGHSGGMMVACVGDASHEGVGDYNLANIKEILEIV